MPKLERYAIYKSQILDICVDNSDMTCVVKSKSFAVSNKESLSSESKGSLRLIEKDNLAVKLVKLKTQM